MIPSGMEGSLYPNWMPKENTKPKGANKVRPYKTSKEEAQKKLSLEEELDAKSVFDPLASSSQSSGMPSSQPLGEPSPGLEAAGCKTPPHFSEGPATIPPFDLSLLNIPNKSPVMSPVTDNENALLNLAPGSPVKNMALTGVGRIGRGSGCSSGADSPMSLGLLAGTNLGMALRIRARSATPTQFDEKQSSSDEEEDMDTMTESAVDTQL